MTLRGNLTLQSQGDIFRQDAFGVLPIPLIRFDSSEYRWEKKVRNLGKNR